MERNRNRQEVAGEKQSFHILLPFPSHSHLSASLPFPTNPATRLQPSSCQSVCGMEGGSRQCRGGTHTVPPCPADGDSVMSTTVIPPLSISPPPDHPLARQSHVSYFHITGTARSEIAPLFVVSSDGDGPLRPPGTTLSATVALRGRVLHQG